MKPLYLSLRTKLETITGLKYVRLFNNQFERSNNDNPDGNNEEAFPYPCAFIEFPSDNEQVSAGAGAKRLNVIVRVHIGFESYKLEDLEVFDLVTLVQDALEGHTDTSFTPLAYSAQRMDYDHNNVYVYQFDFKTTYSDDTKYIKRNAIIKEAPTDLGLTVTLDIDNDIIRTGDGQ